MAIADITGVRISGITSAVPERVVTPDDDAQQFGESIRKVAESTGVWKRHIAPENGCASDLCCYAADRLIESLGWERDSVELLLFVTQTPDHHLPATACTIQQRLGLPNGCAAFDINLGCSGYPYGLWVASQMLKTLRGNGRALLLAGDTLSRQLSPYDQSTVPLFGDAGTATAIERDDESAPMTFVLGTDGAGAPQLMIPAGAHRRPSSSETTRRYERKDGIVKSDEDLHMNGAEVFAFTLREVPKLIKATLQASDKTLDDIDGVVFHQANAFMMSHLARRLKIPDEKFPVALARYGNTSSASIPLAVTDRWGSNDVVRELRLLFAGFGVGWSWSSVITELDNVLLPEVLIMPDEAFPQPNPSSIAA